MSTPNYKLRDDHVATVKHLRDERARNDNTYATKSEVGEIDSDRIVSTQNPNNGLVISDPSTCTATVNIDLGENHEIYKIKPAEYAISLMNRMDCDARYIKFDDPFGERQPLPINDIDMNQKKIKNMANGTLAKDAVNKEQLDLKRDITARDNSIQHSTTNSAITCSTGNKIDIKVNGNTRGYFQQPVGQTTTPLGLVSTDKLQFQSDLSSISAYGSKPLTEPLNTHGLYVTGLDESAKNVQSTVNVSQGNAQVYLTAGHVNPGSGMTDFCALAANGSLQVSGGLAPGISDKQLVLYSAAKNQALPIQSDGKMGYTPSANVAITESTQFPTKGYVDTSASTKLSLSGGTMTGPIVLAGQPQLSTHAVNRDYVDQVENSLLRKAGGTMTGALTLASAPTSNLQAATKAYVDTAVANVTVAPPDLSGYLSKTTTDSQTIAGDITMNSTKIISQSTAATLGAHLTNKTYVDGQTGQRVLKSGDTMTGSLTLSGEPTNNLHATTKSYVDTADNLKVNKAGDTMTGFLNLSALPTNNFHAAPKLYVDNQIATVSGTPSQIATTNGYRLQTDASRIRANQPVTNLPILDLSYADSRLHYQQQLGTAQRFSIPDSSAIQYEWQFKAGGSTRPELKIQDRGELGTQTVRLAAVNGNGTNDTYIQMKPNLNAIELSAPTSYIGSYDANLYTSDQQIVPKKYVDDKLTLGTVPSKIKTGEFEMEVTTTPDIVIRNTSQTSSGAYMVLNQNTIKGENSTQLILNRGNASIVLEDDGQTSSKIRPNVPVIYNNVNLVSNQDQLISQRHGDARYRRSDQDINMGFTQRLTGLPVPQLPRDAVPLDWLENALLFFRPVVTFGFTVLEVPSSPEAFASDLNCITNITYTETGAGVAGFYTLSVSPTLFDGADYVVTCQWGSVRTGVSIVDSQVAPIVVNGYSRTSFNLYVRDTTGGTQQSMITGTLTKRGW